MRAKTAKKTFAKKSFGQNFLVDENIIGKIISALNLSENETVIEIGAGRGALTETLLNSGAEVVAIELERDMLEILREKFGKYPNFTLIEADALKVDFRQFALQSAPFTVKLVANLPYYISTAILQKIIEQRAVFSEAVLMLQREVVERITAEVGNSERGFLTVMVEAYCRAEKLFNVAPDAFRPVPKVWSSVVELTFDKAQTVENEKLFRSLVSICFTQKRKTILNNLKNAANLHEKIERQGGANLVLERAEIVANRRAETLTLEEWQKICREIKDDIS